MSKHTPGPWVYHNPLTQTYDTQDGTKVPVEVVDVADCMADFIVIAGLREKQRAAIKAVEGA